MLTGIILKNFQVCLRQHRPGLPVDAVKLACSHSLSKVEVVYKCGFRPIHSVGSKSGDISEQRFISPTKTLLLRNDGDTQVDVW